MSDIERSQAQAAELALRAHAAAEAWAGASREEVDRVATAMARAAAADAERLAVLACEDSGFGRVDHKTFKNRFVAEYLFERIRQVPTVGVIERDAAGRYVTIAEPVGVVAGLIPVTNPTSTTIFKALASVLARNAIVMAPHPRSIACIAETTRVMQEAGEAAGAPRDLLTCMTEVSIQGTDALMRHYRTDLILATGSRGMVLAAYSSGKPTYAVGPGNSPTYVHRSASDLGETAAVIITSKCFDNGTACASEQAGARGRVDRRPAAGRVREPRGALLHGRGAGGGAAPLLPDGQPRRAERGYRRPVGARPGDDGRLRRAADHPRARVRPAGVGADHPLSHELLCPILKWYVVPSEDDALRTAHALLKYGGDGHTAAIHADEEGIVGRYASVPAYRICVNQGTLFGAMGYTAGWDPSFTLGTGTIGGAISSDNIGPQHLINRKRVGMPVRDWREGGVTEAPAPSRLNPRRPDAVRGAGDQRRPGVRAGRPGARRAGGRRRGHRTIPTSNPGRAARPGRGGARRHRGGTRPWLTPPRSRCGATRTSTTCSRSSLPTSVRPCRATSRWPAWPSCGSRSHLPTRPSGSWTSP
jgi:acyl-CoA reductase-like NAD-dependent aldehyde dehydrogenase